MTHARAGVALAMALSMLAASEVAAQSASFRIECPSTGFRMSIPNSVEVRGSTISVDGTVNGRTELGEGIEMTLKLDGSIGHDGQVKLDGEWRGLDDRNNSWQEDIRLTGKRQGRTIEGSGTLRRGYSGNVGCEFEITNLPHAAG